MMRFGWCAVALLAAASAASAQGGYSTNFDDSTGWTSGGGAGGNGWGVDDNPTNAPGGVAHSGQYSMNYNNGTNYMYGGLPHSGTATSPILTALADNPILKFWCNYQTEGGTQYDKRILKIVPLSGGGAEVKYQFVCGSMGVWHQHTIALPVKTGVVFNLVFLFDTVDAIDNDFAGWFIDTLSVAGAISNIPGTYWEPDKPYYVFKEWNFDGGLDGWSVDSTAPSVVWNADAERCVSQPNSLNYNNGANYDAGVANAGTAVSPPYDVTGLKAAKLVFKCCYQTEPDPTLDVRRIDIRKADGSTVFSGIFHDVHSSDGLGDCGAPGQWHTHEVWVDNGWGEMRIYFNFETGTAANNQFAGWFIDDVTIQAHWLDSSPDTSSSDGGGGCASSIAGGRRPTIPLAAAGIALLLMAIRRPRTPRAALRRTE